MKRVFSVKIIALLLCFSMLVPMFCACSKNKDDGKKVITTEALLWTVKPSIDADGIKPLVRVDFNENTNHYDISYAEVFRIEQNGKYGIIDFNGEIILPVEYDEIFAIRGSNDFIASKTVSGQREQVYVHSDTFETEIAYKTYNADRYRYYWATSNSQLFFVHESEENTKSIDAVPVSPESVAGAISSYGEYVPDNTFGLYANGTNLTGMIYSGAGCFTNGIAAFKSNGKWGYIDSTGKTVISFLYDAVEGYSAFGDSDTPYESYQGYVTVCKDGKYGFLTSTGVTVSELIYNDATPVVNGKAFACENGQWGVLSVDDANSVTVPSAEEDVDKTSKPTKTSDTSSKSTDKSETTTIVSETGNLKSYTIDIQSDEGLNLRSGPGTEYEVLTTLPRDTVVYVDKISDGWAHTTTSGYDGWFNVEFARENN